MGEGGRVALLLVYIGLYLLEPSGAQQCPTSWANTDSGCFKVVTDNKQSWPDAKSQCEQMGGTLATPSTEKKNTDLHTLVQGQFDKAATDNDRNQLRDLWIGGSEEFGIPKWRVLNGLRPAYSQGCYGDQTQIGKRDLPHQSGSLVAQDMTVTMCVNYCRDQQFQVAGLQRAFECHCGNTHGKYGTTSGCTMRCEGDQTQYCGGVSKNSIYNTDTNAAYTNWAYNQPNNFDQFQACGALEKRNQWKMGDEACFKVHYYICHVGTSPCPVSQSRYQLLNGKCLYYNVDTKSSWFEARHACQKLAGELVTIDSEQEWTEIGKQLDSYQKRDQEVFVWIGLFGKQWMWPNNEPVSYTNWDEDEPNNFNKNCMKYEYEEISTRRGYLWHDEICAKQLGYICQTEAEVTTAAPTTTSTTTELTTTANILTASSTGFITPPTQAPAPATPAPATPQPATNAPGQTQPGTNTNGTIAPTSGGGGGNNGGGNNGGTTGTPGVTPSAGASTGGAGGLTTIEIVLIGVLAFIVLVVILLSIFCFCYYKKNKEARGSVHPEKSADARNQVLVPYGDYYGNQYATDPYNNDTYNSSFNGTGYKDNTFYDNESKSGGLVLNANKLYKEDDAEYMNYKPAATLKVMGSNVNDGGVKIEKPKKKKKRGNRYEHNVYEELPDPKQMPRIVLD